MPEMKNNFQGGRMNKDLDERLVPSSEYRDALNVEITTSNDSDVGSLQTTKGNTLLLNLDPTQNFKCIGSISDDKNDKLYFMVAGEKRDLIIEYDYVSKVSIPVCVDDYFANGQRALNFNTDFLRTGINIIDDLLFWTDNNSEPKRINITKGKAGSSDFYTHTNLMVKDLSPSALPNSHTSALDKDGNNLLIQEKHLTVIKKGPPNPPVLEMIDTVVADIDSDGAVGGGELIREINDPKNIIFKNIDDGEWVADNISIKVEHDVDDATGVDFAIGDYLTIFSSGDTGINVRVRIVSIAGGAPNRNFNVKIISGNDDITSVDWDNNAMMVELEQEDAFFQFKFPRFSYRYKYEDGEYSTFSPFTQPAFLPGRFNYLPKEGYNLGMVNRLRKLVIKDFVHSRSMDDDVVSIDILYKESNSSNIYSVQTIKRKDYNPDNWDEWNAVDASTVSGGTKELSNTWGTLGWRGRTTGYLPITTEMIHAVLPANQLLRPWDNVPRKALGQEVIGNRLIYGNYLQNYDLKNLNTNDNNIKVNISASISSDDVGIISPEEIHAGKRLPLDYSPAKSIKSLRTYQLGVIYIDKYGRETPVFTGDERGSTQPPGRDPFTEASVYVPKSLSSKKNQLKVTLKNNPPDWATHFKFFVKETSNEYYNLAMDRFYDAEDGNVWISFPSAERNKIDSETFLTLKNEHDNSKPVKEPARYKVIAIENEAPRFITIQDISIGTLFDDKDAGVAGTNSEDDPIPFGAEPEGFPMPGGFKIHVSKDNFEATGWHENLIEKDISEVFFRVKSLVGISNYYKLKQVAFDNGLNSYVLTSGKQFGGDMSHTSPNETWNNRLRNCELQIIKRIPENKSEFQGRFFVKILKDATLIDRLHMISESTEDLIPVGYQPKVQYINGTADDVSQFTGRYAWNGFGVDSSNPWSAISIDKKNMDFWAIPDAITDDHCDGARFWKMAANNTEANNESESSGWFIDKVEAFRPYYNMRWKKDISGASRDAAFNSWDQFGNIYEPYKDTSINHSRMLQVSPINTYVNTSQGGDYTNSKSYLNIWELKQELFTTPSISKMNGDDLDDGGGVGPSLGIRTSHNLIHLSYAGLNANEGSAGKGPDKWEDAWDNWSFKEGAKHVEDIIFINKLRTPGTLWRWKEDPGQVLYITKNISNVSTSSSSRYTHNNKKVENGFELDRQQGVYLFNFAVFSDYADGSHHAEHTSVNTCGSGNRRHDNKNWKMDWASRYNICGQPDSDNTCLHEMKDLPPGFGTGIPGLTCVTFWGDDVSSLLYPGWNTVWAEAAVSVAGLAACGHGDNPGAYSWWGYTAGAMLTGGNWPEHYVYPTAIYNWHKNYNRRRRFSIHAETAIIRDPNDPLKALGLGDVGPHFYLPTNDHTLPAHFQYDITHDDKIKVITKDPNTGVEFTGKAPGIRPDGMYSGYTDPVPYDFDRGDGDGKVEINEIPQYKSWDESGVAVESNAPGSVTWQIMEPFTADPEKFTSTNPAIWETEPKEDVGLDIYHEIGQIYPIYLNDNTIEQFVGAIHKDIKKNSYVQCWDPPYEPGVGAGKIQLSTDNTSAAQLYDTDIRVIAAYDNYVQLGSVDNNGNITPLHSPNNEHELPLIGSYLIFWRADGSTTEAHVGSQYDMPFGNPLSGQLIYSTWFELVGNKNEGDVGVHNKQIRLPWFNCYSFGNGVESDRIRDDYNQVTIDNGPKASTTIEEPYLEERRKNGFIWSGLYNSKSGINDLNQFIQAEKITKDVNPTYGSIQKLFARDSDLVAFCEDRVLKVLANKDALFNADGNTNLVATDKVLGSIKPFVGDYGISLNPESFASDSYRSYFSDTSRGAVLRLSRDGMTAISDSGMHDWFADNLSIRAGQKIIGSFDDNKGEYNVTLDKVHDSYEVNILGGSKSGNPPFTPTPFLATSNDVAKNLNLGDTITGLGIPAGTIITGKTDISSIGSGAGSLNWKIQLNKAPSQTDIYPLGTPKGYGQAGGGEVIWRTDIKSSTIKSLEVTLSYSEKSKGWVSFKSFIQENGISLNNSYYTFKNGQIYQHHTNEIRNEFYGTQFDSSIDVLFNKVSSSIKSFSTLNYEGSQARITPEINNNPNYYDNVSKEGWYVSEITSDAQELGEIEFWDKENKWFSQIKGVTTEWLNDGTAGNIDPKEFSYQGVGNAHRITCPECPPVTSWNCVKDGAGVCGCVMIEGTDGAYASRDECNEDNNNCCGKPPESYCCGSSQWACRNQDLMTMVSVEIQGEHCGCGGNYYLPTGKIIVPGTTAVAINDIVIGGDAIPPGTKVAQISVIGGISNQLEITLSGGYGAAVGGYFHNWKADATGNLLYPHFNDVAFEAPDPNFASNYCFDPGDGSGAFKTKCECVNDAMCCQNNIDYFFTCKDLPIPSPLIQGCMDDGITTDPWITRQRPATWYGVATNYDQSANVDDCSCEYANNGVQTFDCFTSGSFAGCIQNPSGLGEYPNFAACQADCVAVQESYDCVWKKWGYDCADPGDGSGQWNTLAACYFNSNCVQPPQSWDCDGTGACYDPGTGQGAYSSQMDCYLNSTCLPPETYTCSGPNGISVVSGTFGGQTIPPNTCVDLGFGTGSYTNLSDCVFDCTSTPTTWDCVNNVCIQNYQGTGAYQTYGDCTADPDCCVPTIDPLCIATYIADWTSQGQWTYDPTHSYFPGRVVSWVDPVNGIPNYYRATGANNFSPPSSSSNPQVYPQPIAANLLTSSNPNGYWQACEVTPCPTVPTSSCYSFTAHNNPAAPPCDTTNPYLATFIGGNPNQFYTHLSTVEYNGVYYTLKSPLLSVNAGVGWVQSDWIPCCCNDTNSC